MLKTLIYFPPEYRDLAHKIRENYIKHHHGEVNLVSETDQNDIEYAREEKYDEAIFIEDIDTVVIHDIYKHKGKVRIVIGMVYWLYEEDI